VAKKEQKEIKVEVASGLVLMRGPAGTVSVGLVMAGEVTQIERRKDGLHAVPAECVAAMLAQGFVHA